MESVYPAVSNKLSGPARFAPMKSAAVLLLVLFAVQSCSQSDDVTGSTDGCATTIFPNYNPKDMDQCVEACKKCQHGVTVTCTTSCTLKGAKKSQ
jgi:hypothetical protein